MVFIPLIAVLQQSGLAARVPVPFTGYAGALTLADSFVTWVYTYLVFCIGVVLFFSNERGRRRNPLDWTRRWGVFVSYLVLLLGVPLQLFTAALVLIGIGALCLSLPYENQPGLTEFFITIGSGFITYGPHPSEAADAAATLFSTFAILLACVPIYDALRISGPKAMALVILAPLVAVSMYQIAAATTWYLDPLRAGSTPPPPFFFEPDLLVTGFANLDAIVRNGYFAILRRFVPEAAKWLPFLIIAIWLSLAQARVWRKRPTRHADLP